MNECRSHDEQAEQAGALESFELGAPALVCRWRTSKRTVPLLNRHIRALSQRSVQGRPLAQGLLSWAKLHIEWSLADDTTVPVPDDGVLMLVVDEQGRAAMSVGVYEELADVSRNALAERAHMARLEQRETGVAPEVLCAVLPGELVVGTDGVEALCGAMTLIEQLAQTKGMRVTRSLERVLDEVGAARGCEPQGRKARGCAARDREAQGCREARDGVARNDAAVVLVSDEHGVVVASDCSCNEATERVAHMFAQGYQKLLGA